MKLYLTASGIYAGTQKEAGKGHTLEEVPVSKYELIDYLNKLKFRAVEAIAVATEEHFAPVAPANVLAPSAINPGRSAAELSIAIDDQFDSLPLARQLDLAARAMENARDKL